MDVGLPISQQAAVVGAAALTAAAAYVNAKLSIGRDLKTLRYEKSFGQRLGQKIGELGDTCTMYAIFDQVDPEVEALWFEGRTWTYGELKKDVHRLAAFLENEGIKKGDAVAIFTTNSPEMVITYLALSKLSAICGFININLRDATLEHCLKVSQANTVISTPDLAQFINGPRRHFALSLYSFSSVPPPPADSTITILTPASLPAPSIPSPPTKSSPADLSCLIFTSGTTGKPKACAIRNHQCVLTAIPNSPDYFNPQKYLPLRTYSPLPLFHGTAFFTGVCYSIGNSGTLCLARKFSSSRFFKDVHDSRATRILYVGELCRYLLSSAPGEYDKKHNCIVAAGNGLRYEIWEKFKERFNIHEIREFYRSTEGVAKYDNYNRGAWGAGKVGFAGFYRRNFFDDDTVLVKVDADTAELIRDPKTGFCTKVGIGEPGEVIGRVKARGLLTEYLGNEGATEEKVIRDVFKKGDIWQKMGDLLIQEKEGWVRFHDRMGDTYRWKGENVSAGEVRDHVAKLDGVQDAVVFGVKLASYDGQAGAAMLTLEPSTSESTFMSTLYSGLKKTGLPSYAMPRLVRITKEIETTATFKKSKTDIVSKPWDPSKSKDQDKIYWLDGTTYKPLDQVAWGGIESGRAKL